MADLIKIKGGSGNVPQLQDREIAYSSSEKALYIGTTKGNLKLCNADDIETLISYGTLVSGLTTQINAINDEIADIISRIDVLETN